MRSKLISLTTFTLAFGAWAQEPSRVVDAGVTPDAPLEAAEAQPSLSPGPSGVTEHAVQPLVPLRPVAVIDERVVIDPGRGLTLRTLDGNYSATVRARAQIRDTYAHDTLDTNELNVARLRFFFQGNALSPDLKYMVQLGFGATDFETGNASPVLDAFIEYTRLRDLNLRAGQFYVPFDRARTIRESALQFVDRQLVVKELTLDRDVGMMASSGDLFGLGQRFSYAVFIGGGDGKNRLGPQMAGALSAVRLAVKPFGAFDDDVEGDIARELRPRLAIGLAGAYNVHSSRTQSTFGDTYTLGTFDYAHAAADLVFKYGGFSLLTEAVLRRSVNGDVHDSGTVHEYSRSGWGYFVQAGVMVSRVVEATARWDQLFAFQGTDPKLLGLVSTQGRQLGGGVNVYLDGHILKLQADYFYIWGFAAAPGRHTVRLAVDASF
jgi:hypothetical protein